jgi:hypothetical protein
MHPGFDAQEGSLVGAGLDRVIERGAGLPVDRAFVAARVSQPLFERFDLVRAHLCRIESSGAAGCQTRKGNQN